MLSDDRLARVRGLNAIARQRGQTLAQMALAWTLRGPRITSALIGASSVDQLEQNLGALEQTAFAAGELAAIDRFATRRRHRYGVGEHDRVRGRFRHDLEQPSAGMFTDAIE